MIAYPDAHVPGAFDGQLEPGMVLCVEALITQDGVFDLTRGPSVDHRHRLRAAI